MQVLTYNKNRNKNQDYVAFSSSVVVLVSCTFSRCLVPSSSDEYISSLSIPPDFDDEVPELTNFDTSSVSDVSIEDAPGEGGICLFLSLLSLLILFLYIHLSTNY